ncbi:MAG: signal recognition particle subunit SRP19/SEC65 family protein [Candidatus Nezhaarchaeales archaeon]
MKAILGDRSRIIIYPCYLDCTRSETQGRKIPKKVAVPSPKIDEILRAAQELNLDPLIEKKPHPSWWYEESSRVSVKKIASKRKVLIMLAKKIAENRKEKSKK